MVTRVRVWAHSPITVDALLVRADGKPDEEARAAKNMNKVTKSCFLCDCVGHQIAQCPKPKLRLRLVRPFDLPVKISIRSMAAKVCAGQIYTWAGRNPRLENQNPSWGYIAFSSEGDRDAFTRSLVGSEATWKFRSQLRGAVVPIDIGLLDECANCGSTERENPDYHRTGDAACPSRQEKDPLQFCVVNIGTDIITQVPDHLRGAPRVSARRKKTQSTSHRL
jgi:hypothetical protein